VLVRAERVLQVPVAALYARQDKNYCRRVTGDGDVEAVEVAVGLMNDRRVEILSGLRESDVVLLTAPRMTEKERRETTEKDVPPPGPVAPGSQPARRPASAPALAAEKRLTRTHVTKFTKDTPLLPSGLLGPVRLMAAK
jgi:hypothetical protein